jgi:hypothetical protein
LGSHSTIFTEEFCAEAWQLGTYKNTPLTNHTCSDPQLPVREFSFTQVASKSTVTLELPANSDVEAIVSSLSNGNIQVAVNPTSDPVTVHVNATAASPDRSPMEEVGVFDGWSDEEERVYLDREADEEEVESSSSEEEQPYARRMVRRRRWCLPGCDCERPKGSRKCSCERTGDLMCSDDCQCDPSNCRSRDTEVYSD